MVKEIVLDEFVVMPNHIHGIIGIINEPVGNAYTKITAYHSNKKKFQKENFVKIKTDMRSLHVNYDRSKMLLSKIIQLYKSAVTRQIKKNKNFSWQKSFYDRIIRNEKEYKNIQAYIHYNPLKWEFDIENVNS